MTEREDRLERALVVIEGLCLVAEDDEFAGTLYTIAHQALGYCQTCAPRFEETLSPIERRLSDDKVIDVKRMREKHPTPDPFHSVGTPQ